MEKHDVKYILIDAEMGNMKVDASMTQKDLGKLLLRDDVVLVSVNAPKPSYTRKKRSTKTSKR